MLQRQNELASLAKDKTEEGRGRLLVDLATLILTDPPAGDVELSLFFDIVRRILPLARQDFRRAFSTSAADRGYIPLDVLKCLAVDDIDVAAPVLERSPVFSDDDLIALTISMDDDHRVAIAARAVVSGALSDVLLQFGSRSVLHRLGSNQGAEFTSSGFETLRRRAEKDEDLMNILVARSDLGEKLAAGLRDTIERFASRRKSSDGPRARVVATQAAPRDLRPANAGVASLIAELRAGRRNIDDIVVELAKVDRHADLARLLGDFASIDESQILRVMVRADANGIATVARGLGLKTETYAAIVDLRRRKLKFSTTQARFERSHYDRVDAVEARVTLTAFKDRRREA